MKSNRIWDLGATPINRVARRTTVAKGEHYDFDCTEVDPTGKHWKSPPPLRPLPRLAENLKGITFGRLTVIGVYGNHPKKGTSWVVRCTCGDYEIRYKRAIKNPDNNEDRCGNCNQLKMMQEKRENTRVRK